jgi:monomeric sarcosine oxidase
MRAGRLRQARGRGGRFRQGVDDRGVACFGAGGQGRQGGQAVPADRGGALLTYDAIVLGVGGVGSAALYHLARRGARVLGVDRFAPGHDRGSSHGLTRMIRLAYFEHPDYVPLLRRAFELWEALEREHGSRLYRETGLVQVGPPDGEVVPGVLRAAAEHGLAVEEVSRIEGLSWPDSMRAVYERRAGLLAVEECVRAHAALAERAHAEIRRLAVLDWRADGDGVVVETEAGPIRAARLVLTPGAWAPPEWGVHVLRKSMSWYAAERHDALPAFLFELEHGVMYGFPSIDAFGVKVAEHTGGQSVDDPLLADREVDPAEQARVEAFLGAHVPGVSRVRTRHETCFYTMTPDGHFLLGRHPRWPQVVLAAGLSGHGFKFAPVLGEILADLALDGATRHPIGFLRPDRFGM